MQIKTAGRQHYFPTRMTEMKKTNNLRRMWSSWDWEWKSVPLLLPMIWHYFLKGTLFIKETQRAYSSLYTQE